MAQPAAAQARRWHIAGFRRHFADIGVVLFTAAFVAAGLAVGLYLIRQG